MPRLTKAELAQHRAWLSEWRTPIDTAAYVAAVNDVMGSPAFFRQGGVEFLRDAWLAAQFGRHHHAERVRVINERELWPDFEAQIGDVVEHFECCAGGSRRDESGKALRRRRELARVSQHRRLRHPTGPAGLTP